ncbi:MAG: hypothetical protein ACI8XO_002028 [Verrucomicrobiales bacterium]|jgi:hypothetical protein
MFAIFNQTQDSNRPSEAPRFDTPTPKQDARYVRIELDRQIGEAGSKLILTIRQTSPDRAIGKFRISATIDEMPEPLLPAQISQALAIAPAQRSPEQEQAITEHYRPLDPDTKIKLAKIKIETIPVMLELPPEKRRKTHVMQGATTSSSASRSVQVCRPPSTRSQMKNQTAWRSPCGSSTQPPP